MSQINKVPPPSPVLPLPPLEYDVAYLNNLVRILNYFIQQTDNPGALRGTKATFSQSNSNFGSLIPATSIKAQQGYIINSVGTTSFTSFGASSNTVGIQFVATKDGDAGSGTGVVFVPQNSMGVPVPIVASLVELGKSYTIITVGTSNFTTFGASSNTVGIRFTATSGGSGTGTVIEAAASGTIWCDPSANFALKILP